MDKWEFEIVIKKDFCHNKDSKRISILKPIKKYKCPITGFEIKVYPSAFAEGITEENID